MSRPEGHGSSESSAFRSFVVTAESQLRATCQDASARQGRPSLTGRPASSAAAAGRSSAARTGSSWRVGAAALVLAGDQHRPLVQRVAFVDAVARLTTSVMAPSVRPVVKLDRPHDSVGRPVPRRCRGWPRRPRCLRRLPSGPAAPLGSLRLVRLGGGLRVEASSAGALAAFLCSDSSYSLRYSGPPGPAAAATAGRRWGPAGRPPVGRRGRSGWPSGTAATPVPSAGLGAGSRRTVVAVLAGQTPCWWWKRPRCR